MLAPSRLSPCHCQAAASHLSAPVGPVQSAPPWSSSRPGTTLASQATAALSPTIASSLSTTRRQTRPKKNHLRTKQLSRNVPREFPDPSVCQPHESVLLDELAGRVSDEISPDTIRIVPLVVGEDSSLLTIEEDEREDEMVSLMESVLMPRTEVGEASHLRAAAAATTEGIVTPKLLIDMFVYLVKILVVQTVFAILVLGREGLDNKDETAEARSERNKKKGFLTWPFNVEKRQEIHSEGQVGTATVSELQNKITEIRAMAKTARVNEAKETVQGGEDADEILGDIKQEVSQKLKRLAMGKFQDVMRRDIGIKSSIADATTKLNLKRRSEFDRYRAVLNRKTPKGFNGTQEKVSEGITTNEDLNRKTPNGFNGILEKVQGGVTTDEALKQETPKGSDEIPKKEPGVVTTQKALNRKTSNGLNIIPKEVPGGVASNKAINRKTRKDFNRTRKKEPGGITTDEALNRTTPSGFNKIPKEVPVGVTTDEGLNRKTPKGINETPKKEVRGVGTNEALNRKTNAFNGIPKKVQEGVITNKVLNRKPPKGFNGTPKKVPRGVTTDNALNRKTTNGFNEIPQKVSGVVTTDEVDRSKGTERPAVDHNSTAGGSLVSQEGSSKKLHNHHRNWWHKLPHVLGIYLQRTSGGKKYRGLYTLKINSHSDGSPLPVTIVFEDRGDATNLCYLLKSYFKDLSGVRAGIVPITTQELMGAMEEKSLNAVVIKKGQVRFHASQLLPEVEAQLQFIVDQSLKQEMHECIN